MTTTLSIKEQPFELLSEFTKLDGKSRITLGSAIIQSKDSASGYMIYRNKEGLIVLVPATIIPTAEAWLHDNKEALASVRRGIEQAGRGQAHEMDLSELAPTE